MTGGSPVVSASEMIARWAGSTGPTEAPGTATSPPETWGERLYAALPLFIVGGACLAVAVDFTLSGGTTPFMGNSSVRLAPWALFYALAVTGLSAGVFALLLEDEPEAKEMAAAAPKPAPLPPWDESSITPVKTSHVRPRTWEQQPLDVEDIANWTPSELRVERVSPDLVLVQIDEIAASLRKKTPPSQTS